MSRIKFLLAIILIGSGLRLIYLARYPIHLSIDEVAIGYDAFSLLFTGRDYHGHPVPWSFVSLGDYKAPLYIYLSVVPVALLGLTETAVRLTSALAGILAIPLVYLLVRRLGSSRLALTAAGILAVSPWHLRLSRAAYEANLGFTLALLGLVFLSRFLSRSRKFDFIASAFFFILSVSAYHSPKLFLPAFLLLMIGFYRRRIKSLLLLVLLIGLVLVPAANSRGLAVNLTRDPEIHLALTTFSPAALFPRLFLQSTALVTRYLQYFDPTFWLSRGLDLTGSDYFDHGLIYLIDAPFLAIGIGWLIRRRPRWLVAWILASPVPAAVTLNDYHFIRSSFLILPGVILTAVGLSSLLSRRLLLTAYLGILIISGLVLADLYLVHLPVQKSHESFYPSAQISRFVLKETSFHQYDRVIIDPFFGPAGPDIQGVPELYLLFYGRISPATYRSSLVPEGFGLYRFRHIEWVTDRQLRNTLLVGSPWSLPVKDIPASQLLAIFNFANSTPAYYVVSTR